MKQIRPQSFCNLEFKHTITRWDEAIPLGNGVCGALIWGASDGLRFSLDRGDIWDTTPPQGIENERFCYREMVRLARNKEEAKIRRIFDAPYNHPLPSKLPAGKIIFDFGSDGNVVSQLDIAQAQAHITIGERRLDSFLHAVDHVGFIRVNQSMDCFRFWIENPKFGVKSEQGEDWENLITDSVKTASLKQLHYPAPEIVEKESTRYFIQSIREDFSYGIFLKVKEENGYTLIVYTVETSVKGENWRQEALRSLEEALERGYEEALASHGKWWENYWSESSIHVPDTLFEKNWYLTNYFLACCSRKGSLPMPLQGVWTADDGLLPPWKGDYHHDLNTQMSYYSYLKANHLEEGESFIDYLWSMVECGRRFARDFYGTKGMCLPSVMSMDGAALGGWGMYSLSPVNQLWLCQVFERHYRFTGDKAFLKERVYPYLSETAEMILGLLEERTGMYYLPISSSPEIHDDTIQAFVTPNSNYDLALLRYLFTLLAELAHVLKNEEWNRWESVLEKLPTLAVTEEGVLMISPDEALSESHRHHAQAMAIHPLGLIAYDTEEGRRIIDATVLDLERLGTGMWVGYSFAWMAELYAIQGNGNGAAYQLQVFWKNHCSPNGFHLNGDYLCRGTSSFHYRPFTLEGNFCAADALQEMLLQSEGGVLRLFPAIPQEWKEEMIFFEQLRAENGLLVSAQMYHGKITELILQPQFDGMVTIADYNNIKYLKCNMPLKIEICEEDAGLFLYGGSRYQFC